MNWEDVVGPEGIQNFFVADKEAKDALTCGACPQTHRSPMTGRSRLVPSGRRGTAQKTEQRCTFIQIGMKLSLFIQKNSSKTTFIPKNTFIQTTFIQVHFHHKPLSSKTTFIQNDFPFTKPNHNPTNLRRCELRILFSKLRGIGVVYGSENSADLSLGKREKHNSNIFQPKQC